MTDTRIPSRRVCMVQLGGIGDVVHGMPSANALKRDDPERQITWVVAPPAAALLQPHPGADRVVVFDRKRGLRGVAGLWRELRPHDFDVVLNFGVYFKTAVPTFIARAPIKLGWERPWARDMTWLSANRHMAAPRHIPHTQDQQFEFLKYLGVPIEPLEWQITITEEERREQEKWFSQFDGRVVGIVPTSGREAKDWDTGRLGELATILERDFGLTVLLLGGPSHREAARAREVAETSEAQIKRELGPDLRRSVCLIDGCDLLIAPDTGPLHVAHALGTPVVGLYAHTDPTRDGPTRAYQDIWVDRYNLDGPEQPAEPPGSHVEAGRMSLITVSDVVEVVQQALARYVVAPTPGVS